jgi:CheY-like chemotaxis protein
MSETPKKRVLVVDDEADVVTYLTALLTDAGYEVGVARNGEEALASVRADPPDLISLDITMPERSGVGFYRKVKEDESLRSIPVVIVTGVTNPMAGSKGEGTFESWISSRRQIPPPDGFFEKPIDKDEYLAKVAELLA